MTRTGPTAELDTLWPDAGFSAIERALLSYLLAVHGQPVSRDELLREVWGYAPSARSRTVEVTIRRLRTKIEADPSAPEVLQTQRGHGYRLVLPGAAERPTDAGTRRADLEARLAEWLGDDQAWVTLLHAPSGRNTNLPPSLDAFVGRSEDRRALEAVLESGARWITLHGPGGVGKTRLGRELASALTPTLPGGAWFCDLSSARTTPDMLALVAADLGIVRAADATTSVEAALAALFGARGPALLVLDNFEQLEAEARAIVPRLLGAAPRLTVLVTSRERLGLAGEHVHTLTPLSHADAVRLLRTRIEAVRLDRAEPLDDEVLADIAALLEGIPLALEMTAARARILPLRELRSRLRSSFDVLSLDRADVPARQRTLGQAIGWSWDLLSDDERRVLVQLAVFRGGCTLAVAEGVLEVERDALSAIGGLLDKSMLRAWDQRGTRRIGLLEVVREHVSTRGGDALSAARDRHATWAVGLAQACADSLETDPDARRQLLAEVANLVEAHGWLVQRGDPDALVLLEALHHLHHTHGVPEDLAERARHTRDCVRVAGGDVARLHLVAAAGSMSRGGLDVALAEARAGLERSRPSQPVHARLLRLLSAIQLDREHYDDALALAERAVEQAAADGAWIDLAQASNALGALLHHRGRLDEAITAYRRAIGYAERAGAHRIAAVAELNLGGCLGLQGRADEGLAALAHAERRAAPWEDLEIAFGVQHQRALLLARAGRLDEADALFTVLLRNPPRLDGREPAGAVDLNAGIVALLVGKPMRARVLLEGAAGKLFARSFVGRLALTAQQMLLVAVAALDDLPVAESLAAELIERDTDDLPEPQRAGIALAVGHLDLARARHAEDPTPHVGAAAARLRVRGTDHPENRSARTLLERALEGA